MKKLLLAVAVSSVAAGSANAATIYEKDGFTYKLNGDFQVQMRQDIGNDENLGVEFDDLEMKNYVSYDLGNEMKAFGRVDFGFKDYANQDDKGEEDLLEEAYVGMKFGVASLSFGKQNFAGDEFGVEEAIESPLDEDQFDAEGTDGDDTLRVDVELENVYVAASYELEAEGTDSEGDEYFDLFASTEFAGLTLAGAYQQRTPINGDSVDTYGVSAAYDFDIAGLAADYSISDNDGTETTLYNVAATFDVASTTGVALGMQNQEEDGNEDVTGWYANVTYKFPEAKNVRLFAEIADTDEDDTDMGYLAGLRVKF
ncbi:MAG: porin [Alteromonadaceae bacterium]|nr:porin [Alteromonadaceae bacterium]